MLVLLSPVLEVWYGYLTEPRLVLHQVLYLILLNDVDVFLVVVVVAAAVPVLEGGFNKAQASTAPGLYLVFLNGVVV